MTSISQSEQEARGKEKATDEIGKGWSCGARAGWRKVKSQPGRVNSVSNKPIQGFKSEARESKSVTLLHPIPIQKTF